MALLVCELLHIYQHGISSILIVHMHNLMSLYPKYKTRGLCNCLGHFGIREVLYNLEFFTSIDQGQTLSTSKVLIIGPD